MLPFQNTSADSNLDYLSTALPDEVITALSYAPTLTVRPFSMSQRFTAQNFDPHQAGQQLKVTDVVTGHFLLRADRVSVTLEAMDITKDEVTWRGSVEAATNDMLTLRQEVTSALQKGLLPSLGVSNVELSVTKPRARRLTNSTCAAASSAIQTPRPLSKFSKNRWRLTRTQPRRGANLLGY